MGGKFIYLSHSALNSFLVISNPGFVFFSSWTSLGEAKENFHYNVCLASGGKSITVCIVINIPVL